MFSSKKKSTMAEQQTSNVKRVDMSNLLQMWQQYMHSDSMNLVLDATEDLGGVFLGNIEAAKDVRRLRENNIRAVLTVAARSGVKFSQSEIAEHEVIAADDVSTFNLSRYFEHIIAWIEQQRRMQYNVLIHCFAGISRSATALIAYIMQKFNWPLERALSYCKSKRGVANPNSGFLKQLTAFENKLRVRQNTQQSSQQQSPQLQLHPLSQQQVQQQPLLSCQTQTPVNSKQKKASFSIQQSPSQSQLSNHQPQIRSQSSYYRRSFSSGQSQPSPTNHLHVILTKLSQVDSQSHRESLQVLTQSQQMKNNANYITTQQPFNQKESLQLAALPLNEDDRGTSDDPKKDTAQVRNSPNKLRKKNAKLTKFDYFIDNENIFARSINQARGIYLQGARLGDSHRSIHPKSVTSNLDQWDVQNNKLSLQPPPHAAINAFLNITGQGQKKLHPSQHATTYLEQPNYNSSPVSRFHTRAKSYKPAVRKYF